MNQTTTRFLWICLGGAFGTGARYLISVWALETLGRALPWGTLIVNVVGSFFVSAIMQAALTTDLLSPTLRPRADDRGDRRLNDLLDVQLRDARVFPAWRLADGRRQRAFDGGRLPRRRRGGDRGGPMGAPSHGVTLLEARR